VLMRSEFFKLTGQTICARQKSGRLMSLPKFQQDESRVQNHNLCFKLLKLLGCWINRASAPAALVA
jgi:hypothetical protein